MKKFYPFVVLLFYCNVLVAQGNFKPEMLMTDPVKDENDIGTAASIKSHEAFLQNAIESHNDLYHLYGLIYLHKDYRKQTDFVTAANYLLEAEKFAKSLGKPGWIGIVKGYRATLTGMLDNNPQLSIKQFKEAIQECAQAKDSLCMGESYEQIGTKYNQLGAYKKAHYYFQLAIPLLRKFGADENLSAAYNNFSTVLINEKKYETAVIYIDSAITIAVKNKNLHSEVVFRANMAGVYLELKEFDKALALYDYCEPISSRNNWTDNLAQTYYSRYVIYEKQGRYKEALEYLNKHHALKENITGEKIQSQIAALEGKYKKGEQQLLLEKSQRAKERYAGISFTLLTLLLLGLWFWRKQNLSNRKEAAANQKHLTDLTNLMIEKNSAILQLEEKLSEAKRGTTETEAEERTLYSQRILTDSDWASFKAYFEKVHPNYINKIREAYPHITDAEERLFLCIKINLKSKETASMLGISNDSVKKGRSRLRKRLNLTEKEDLEEFVRNFTKERSLSA